MNRGSTLVSASLAFMVGNFIFIGIPMLTWLGAEDAFLADPVRIAYCISIACLQVFSVICVPHSLQRNTRNQESSASGGKLDLVLIGILSVAIIVLTPLTCRLGIGVFQAGSFGFAGVACVIVGFLLMQLAEKALGAQFSVAVTLQKDHRLIQDGVFKRVRHPRYLGIMVFFTGIAVVFQSLAGIAMTIALFFVLLWRITREEKMLQEHFREEWELYRSRSWRLLPFIY